MTQTGLVLCLIHFCWINNGEQHLAYLPTFMNEWMDINSVQHKWYVCIATCTLKSSYLLDQLLQPVPTAASGLTENDVSRTGLWSCDAGSDSPAVTVGSIDVDAKLNQKLDNFSVAGTDSVVQRCNALVVRHAGVVHLQDGSVIM